MEMLGKMFGVAGSILGALSRLFGSAVMLLIVAASCVVGFAVYTVRLGYWDQPASHLFLPVFLFVGILTSSAVLVFNDPRQHRFTGWLLTSCIVFMSVSFVFNWFPGTAAALKLKAQVQDEQNRVEAEATTIQEQYVIVCPSTGYFGTNHEQKSVALIGYVPDSDGGYRCYNIRNRGSNLGIDPKTGTAILPVTKNIVIEIFAAAMRKAAETPPPTAPPPPPPIIAAVVAPAPVQTNTEVRMPNVEPTPEPKKVVHRYKEGEIVTSPPPFVFNPPRIIYRQPVVIVTSPPRVNRADDALSRLLRRPQKGGNAKKQKQQKP